MKKNAIVFIVNSLCNGGAERVTVNMANSYSKKYKVYIITLFNQQTYELEDNVEVISIYDKKPNKIKKVLFLFAIKNKIDKIINMITNDYDISLITSHLPYSNLISRLSKYRKEIINVIHISYKAYSKRFGYLYVLFLKFLYNNMNIVTVSKGCEEELINYYKLKPNNITHIYNPINYDEIGTKMLENIEHSNPYFLFVGRLTDQKRPLLLLDVFYKGKFYDKYSLNIIGVGEYEEQLKEKIKEYNLEKSVKLCGWKSNVYSYMNKATLLINTSKYEAFPMTMIEALASDCPIVSFDIEYGPNEILTNDLECYLAEDNNIDDMISKINIAIDKYPQNLRERAKIYSVENINNKYLQTYSKWILEGESNAKN